MRGSPWQIGLSFMAGFVDALGFVHMGGYFVAFMSGNSTQTAAALPDGLAGAVLPASLIALFVIGVMAGSAIVEQRFSGSPPCSCWRSCSASRPGACCDTAGRCRGNGHPVRHGRHEHGRAVRPGRRWPSPT